MIFPVSYSNKHFCDFQPWKPCMFVYVDALHSSQQYFEHVIMISCFPGLSQYLAEDKVSCCRIQHSDYSESQTSNPPIRNQMLYHLSYCALLDNHDFVGEQK